MEIEKVLEDKRSFSIEKPIKRGKNVIFIICILLTLMDMSYKYYHGSPELISTSDLILIGLGIFVFIVPIENLKKIGTSKAFLQLRRTTDTNTQKIEELHNAMFHYLRLSINHNKLDHLSNLITFKQDCYHTGDTLKEELRDLRSVRFIEPIRDCNISDLPPKFILSDFFKITKEGRECFDFVTSPLKLNQQTVEKEKEMEITFHKN